MVECWVEGSEFGGRNARPTGYRIETDAIYHRNRYIWGFGNAISSETQIERANSWEFPVLAKYYLPFRKIRPFAEGGIAARTISGTIYEYGETLNVPTGVYTPFSGSVKTNWSPSQAWFVGGGVRLSIGRLQLSPQIRYTYWTSTPINTAIYNDMGFRSAQNQVDGAIGVGWRFR